MRRREYWSEKYGELRRPISLQSPWGDPHTKDGRMRFQAYLKSVVSANQFLSSTGKIEWLSRRSLTYKRRILEKIRGVDPQGYEKLRGKLISIGFVKKKQEEMFSPKELEEDMRRGTMAVEAAQDETPGVSLVRLVPSVGLKNLVALCMLAGYTKSEIAKFLRMEEGDLGDVTKDDLSNARKNMAQSIVMLADQKVLKDFLDNKVSDHTEMVDRIVARRMKTAIDMHAEERETGKQTPDALRDTDSDDRLKERFGVDRKSGVTVDVQPRKVRKVKEELE